MVLTRSAMNKGLSPQPVTFDALPTEILEAVLSYLPYATVERLRLVSRKMNFVCGDFLSHSFQRIQKMIAAQFSNLKSGMPRRDSLRRRHPRSNELEIMDMLQARLSLLQLGMGKHLAQNHFQFFAGEVLDESCKIMRYVQSGGNERPYEVTEELFDLTSMALDFFKENIEPTLPEISSYSSFDSYYIKLEENLASTSNEEQESAKSAEIDAKTRNSIKNITNTLKRKLKSATGLARKQQVVMKKVAEHDEQIAKLARRLDESEKSCSEWTVQLAVVKQDIDKCKANIQLYHAQYPNLPEPFGTTGNDPPDQKIPLKILLQEQEQ